MNQKARSDLMRFDSISHGDIRQDKNRFKVIEKVF